MREARGVDFYLRDDSGVALIQVEGRAFPALEASASLPLFLSDDPSAL